MKPLITMSATLSFMFLKSSHPMMLTMLIVAQCLLLCLIIYMKTAVAWLSYILFMIFLGGMMVLFSYICSLASNETIKNKKELKKMYSTIVISMVFYFLSSNQNNLVNCSMNETFLKMFNKMFFTMTILIMVYLLLAMVIIVKNMSFEEGPLRAKKN